MKARMGGNRTAITSLQVTARLAGWASPTSRDWKSDEGTEVYALKRREHSRGKPLGEQARRLVGWATPRSTDADKAVRSPEGAAKEIARKGPQNDLGLTTGLIASTGKRGALNPAFSLWLMGYPTHWMDVAPSAASVRSGARGTR